MRIMAWWKCSLMIGAACLPQSSLRAAPFVIELGKITETRVKDAPGNLAVEVKVSGELIGQVDGSHLIIEKAVDDTGADLATQLGWNEKTMVEVYAPTKERKAIFVTPTLKGTARNAKRLSEFSGIMELVIPPKDPESIITVNLSKQDGRPVQSEVLTREGISATAWLKVKYNARKLPAPTPPSASSLPPNAPRAFRERFMQPVGPPSVIDAKTFVLEFADPRHHLMSVVVRGPDGGLLEPRRVSRFQNAAEEKRVFELDGTISSDLRISLIIATPKSIQREAFSFRDVVLP